jgi:putative endonuclease
MKNFYVYLLLCSDNTLYCGYTTDIEKRLISHNIGTVGAKYTKARRPVKIVYSEILKSKGEALKREIEIKKMTRQQKLKMIQKT